MDPSSPIVTTAGTPAPGEAAIHEVGYLGDDARLVADLRRGHPGAPAALYDRYASHLERVLCRVLGFDLELPDLLHEVFARAFAEVDRLEDPGRLKAWLTSIAVFTARERIRYRRRRRWLVFLAPASLPEPPHGDVPPEAREALRCTYELLDELPANERIVFALRIIDGMELSQVADACDISLATVKRRLSRAERRFVDRARRHPVLRRWVEEGGRW